MRLNACFAGLALTAAAFFTLPAFAQPVPAAPEKSATATSNCPPCDCRGRGHRGPRHQMRDCAQAPDPQACQARRAAFQKAREECRDKAGPERRQCMQAKMPAPDCSKAPNPERCNAMLKAREACKDKMGPDRRQCMREQFSAK